MSRFEGYAPRQNAGWQSAQTSAKSGWSGQSRSTKSIEGEIVARSTSQSARFDVGTRVLHQKFGPGYVSGVDGNKLTVDFDKAGRKMVMDSFVEKA
jgi:DNA helicase II / ATP-dependent DNA helicase PcrA